MKPTYILAPNATTHPDGFAKIGTIIADPFQPLKPLSLPLQPAETLTHRQDFEFEDSSGHAVSGGVWAQFLQVAGVKLGGSVGKGSTTQYRADRLETVYMRSYPTDEEATARAAEPKVEAAMRAGIRGRQPVYMITGLKIARGFAKVIETTNSSSVEAGVNAIVTTEVSTGVEGSFSRDKGYRQSTKASVNPKNDVVFAYQLHIIVPKGWRTRTANIDLYAPKAALLHDESKTNAETFEAPAAVLDDFIVYGEENEENLNLSECLEDGKEYAVVSLQEE